MFGLAYTGRDSKKLWATRTIALEGIEFKRHPNYINALLEVDISVEAFYFQKALNIDAINNETKCIDRKAHLFWENPVIDAKINDLMSTLSNVEKLLQDLLCLETARIQDDFSWSKRKNRRKEFNWN